MKTIFIIGEFTMAFAHLIVAISVQQNWNIPIIVFIMTFLTTYQASQGSYFFPYAAQVAVDTANSIASMVLWTGVLAMALFS